MIGLVFAERDVATTLINPAQVNMRTASDLAFDPITEKLYQWVYRRGASRLRMVPGQVEFAETSGRLAEHLERLALPENLTPVVMG